MVANQQAEGCVIPAFTLAVITDAVVGFAPIPFLVAMVSGNQNFPCLNIVQSADASAMASSLEGLIGDAVLA